MRYFILALFFSISSYDRQWHNPQVVMPYNSFYTQHDRPLFCVSYPTHSKEPTAADIVAPIMVGVALVKSISEICGIVVNGATQACSWSFLDPSDITIGSNDISIAEPLLADGAVATEGIAEVVGAGLALLQEAQLHPDTHNHPPRPVLREEICSLEELHEEAKMIAEYMASRYDNRFAAPDIMGNVKLRFDWRHLDDIEIVKKFNKKIKLYESRLRGFHHDYQGRLERRGILELINKQELGSGA
jgi:hypothetical protein